MMDDLDDRYPGGRLNLMEGTIQYQPGTLSRKQIAEMQKNIMSNKSVTSQLILKLITGCDSGIDHASYLLLKSLLLWKCHAKMRSSSWS
jgi:hypothetical protein